MTIGVNSIGSTGSISASVGIYAPVATTNTSSSTPVSTNSSGFHSPRIVQDPGAGSLTQYLSNDGDEVLLQTPNKITAAYLREGLQRDGTRKPSAVTTA